MDCGSVDGFIVSWPVSLFDYYLFLLFYSSDLIFPPRGLMKSF